VRSLAPVRPRRRCRWPRPIQRICTLPCAPNDATRTTVLRNVRDTRSKGAGVLDAEAPEDHTHLGRQSNTRSVSEGDLRLEQRPRSHGLSRSQRKSVRAIVVRSTPATTPAKLPERLPDAVRVGVFELELCVGAVLLRFRLRRGAHGMPARALGPSVWEHSRFVDLCDELQWQNAPLPGNLRAPCLVGSEGAIAGTRTRRAVRRRRVGAVPKPRSGRPDRPR
jgi:hypothetical protein